MAFFEMLKSKSCMSKCTVGARSFQEPVVFNSMLVLAVGVYVSIGGYVFTLLEYEEDMRARAVDEAETQRVLLVGLEESEWKVREVVMAFSMRWKNAILQESGLNESSVRMLCGCSQRAAKITGTSSGSIADQPWSFVKGAFSCLYHVQNMNLVIRTDRVSRK